MSSHDVSDTAHVHALEPRAYENCGDRCLEFKLRYDPQSGRHYNEAWPPDETARGTENRELFHEKIRKVQLEDNVFIQSDLCACRPEESHKENNDESGNLNLVLL